MITMITASFVLGVAAAGVAALPWREDELNETSRAWDFIFGAGHRFANGLLSDGARRVEDVFAAGDVDALLPASLPRPMILGRQTSSGYATPSKSRAARGSVSSPVRAWGSV